MQFVLIVGVEETAQKIVTEPLRIAAQQAHLLSLLLRRRRLPVADVQPLQILDRHVFYGRVRDEGDADRANEERVGPHRKQFGVEAFY